ncbi:hypothetical protein [Paralysiella testudinis]|uniref:Uncharacterized protein n=1 Tax=Paralysiella testudinis TaxID=2809020 RepID=A0A892ZN35_9NEIS|nr:hypothetical protein [Paralysiella testudinis]QRQ83044.1 hypothetical protein JQU52_06700 [Paralysiella testudinis]
MSQRQYPCFVVCKHPAPALFFYLSPSESFCIHSFPISYGSIQISSNVFSRARFVPNVPIYSDIPLVDTPDFLTVEYEQVKASDLAAMRERGEL